MEQIALIPVPLAALQAAMADVLKTALSEYQKATPPPPAVTEPDTLLTRRQVAQIIGVSLPTLHNMTKAGKLTGYRFGHVVRYKLGEVEKALKVIPSRNLKNG